MKILLGLAFIQFIRCILIGVNGDRKQYCFSKYVSKTDTLSLKYVVTGDTMSEQTTVKIWNPKKEEIFSKSKSDDGELDHEAKEDGYYKLCFMPDQDKHTYISFEYYTNSESGHIINMAKDGINI
jgi:hypothetical protein